MHFAFRFMPFVFFLLKHSHPQHIYAGCPFQIRPCKGYTLFKRWSRRTRQPEPFLFEMTFRVCEYLVHSFIPQTLTDSSTPALLPDGAGPLLRSVPRWLYLRLLWLNFIFANSKKLGDWTSYQVFGSYYNVLCVVSLNDRKKYAE